MARNYELEKELYDYCVRYASRSQFPLEFKKIRAHFSSQPILAFLGSVLESPPIDFRAMTIPHFILILSIIVLLLSVSLPGNSLAAVDQIKDNITGVVSIMAKGEEKRRHEVRQQRADARQEVLFWFRTHPGECLLPQAVVDEMVQSGGYWSRAVSGLVGARNPFFEEFKWSPEVRELLKEEGVELDDPISPCSLQPQPSP